MTRKILRVILYLIVFALCSLWIVITQDINNRAEAQNVLERDAVVVLSDGSVVISPWITYDSRRMIPTMQNNQSSVPDAIEKPTSVVFKASLPGKVKICFETELGCTFQTLESLRSKK